MLIKLSLNPLDVANTRSMLMNKFRVDLLANFCKIGPSFGAAGLPSSVRYISDDYCPPMNRKRDKDLIVDSGTPVLNSHLSNTTTRLIDMLISLAQWKACLRDTM